MSDPTAARPKWLDDLLADYQAGVASTFLLWGNVHDYDGPSLDVNVREYLALHLSRLFTVATYSPDEGITFDGPTSITRPARARFLAIASGEQQQPQQPQSEADRLLAQLGSGTTGAADPELPSAPSSALPLLVDFLSRANGEADGSGKRPCVVVERADLLFPPADKSTLADSKAALLSLMHRVGTSRAMNDKRGALLILLAPTLVDVHPDLRASSSGVRAIQIPPPDYDERLRYVAHVVKGKGLELEMPAAELAAQTAGLLRRHIEDVALRAVAAGGCVTRELVKARKGELLSTEYADTLTLLEPDVDWADVGGADLVKDWMQRKLVGVARAGDARRLARMPVGLCLMGPPGTGKTWLLRALAKALGWNAVSLDGDKIKGGIVGESERRLEKALTGIEALAPCVVLIDELEQMMPRRVLGGGGDGGSAVQSQAFGRLLQFFAEPAHRGRVLAIGATNRPDQVDAAMFRPGRFDVKIPILPPDDDGERAAMLSTILRRYDATTDVPLLDIAASTDGWTPAELERLVLLALDELDDEPELGLGAALTAARGWLKPSTREIQLQTRLALQECDDLRLVPVKYRPSVGERVPVDELPEVEQRAPVRGARSLDL
jgi:transitional endoplasmic reticulum ATPase